MSGSKTKILFKTENQPISSDDIIKEIRKFPKSYVNTTNEIINNSRILDKKGEVFVKCATRILSNFKMTRRGPFSGDIQSKLFSCWEVVGDSLLKINKSVLASGLSRDRFILEINDKERDYLFTEIWLITKKLLPFSMGENTYGLVAASKILFSVLPEIVLPVDNAEWIYLFKTVDITDVLRFMVSDIQKWESETEKQLNKMDQSNRLTTLPSVYNVMAMAARPKIYGKKN